MTAGSEVIVVVLVQVAGAVAETRQVKRRLFTDDQDSSAPPTKVRVREGLLSQAVTADPQNLITVTNGLTLADQFTYPPHQVRAMEQYE